MGQSNLDHLLAQRSRITLTHTRTLLQTRTHWQKLFAQTPVASCQTDFFCDIQFPLGHNDNVSVIRGPIKQNRAPHIRGVSKLMPGQCLQSVTSIHQQRGGPSRSSIDFRTPCTCKRYLCRVFSPKPTFPSLYR